MMQSRLKRRKRTSKQRELNLYLGRRGGRRPHAGRPPGPRPLVRHESREDFPSRHPCHVTLKVRGGIRSLRTPFVVREIEAAFRSVRGRRKDFRLVQYSIQDDHAHLIVEANGVEALGRGMKSLASRFAFAVNRALGRTGKVLADRYHLVMLETRRQVRNALAYVLLNARRHAAKRIERLRRRGVKVAPLARARGLIDTASSARWFDGWRRDIAIDRAPPRALGSEPAVVEPETWLLTEGWRLHGLLDPDEIPGSLNA
jgi:putative transposase